MAMSSRGKRVSEAMKQSADQNRCPVCGRGAAMTWHQVGDRSVLWCRWIDLGKCESTMENDMRLL